MLCLSICDVPQIMPGMLFLFLSLDLLAQSALACSTKGTWWCVEKLHLCCLRNLWDQGVTEHEV